MRNDYDEGIPNDAEETKADWYFEFQDSGTGKEVGFAGFHNQSEKSNVCRVEIGSLEPAHEKQIATKITTCIIGR